MPQSAASRNTTNNTGTRLRDRNAATRFRRDGRCGCTCTTVRRTRGRKRASRCRVVVVLRVGKGTLLVRAGGGVCQIPPRRGRRVRWGGASGCAGGNLPPSLVSGCRAGKTLGTD